MKDATVGEAIAIIGAGMAGFSAAKVLADHGHRATMFEKSRGIGGRMATRRVSDEIAFDHGGQYARVRSDGFAAFLDGLGDNASTWQPRAKDNTVATDKPLRVGAPGMNRLLEPLRDTVDLRLNTLVSSVAEEPDGVVLTTEDGIEHSFDHVICTVPVPQARNLFAHDDALIASMKVVQVDPCWSLMVAFETPLDVPFDAWREVSVELGWVARNTSKPSREGLDCWIVHARGEWSRDNLERSKEDVAPDLLALFALAMGQELPAIRSAHAHRWRYSQTIAPLGQPYLTSSAGRCLIGGDWALGGRIEAAYGSGTEIGRAAVDMLS
ncbi:MAG: FAD-dependent oxidoreductase [Pseudomonadota bacterium]